MLEFGGKLLPIRLLLRKSDRVDAYYEYSEQARDGGRRAVRAKLPNASIIIMEHCFEDEALLQGTMLHEMIHQYQTEVLDDDTNHDATFRAMARKLERKYGFDIR